MKRCLINLPSIQPLKPMKHLQRGGESEWRWRVTLREVEPVGQEGGLETTAVLPDVHRRLLSGMNEHVSERRGSRSEHYYAAKEKHSSSLLSSLTIYGIFLASSSSKHASGQICNHLLHQYILLLGSQ